jgi:uncharacterized protein (TIGR02246 family)
MHMILVLAAFILAIVPDPAHAQIARLVSAPDSGSSSEIARIRHDYLDAANGRDAQRMSMLYAEDAVFVPTDGVLLRGRTEIASYFEKTLARSGTAPAVTITRSKTDMQDDVGSEAGSFEETDTTGAGALTRVTGLYVVVYTRGSDGQWRVAIEVRSHGNQEPLLHW